MDRKVPRNRRRSDPDNTPVTRPWCRSQERSLTILQLVFLVRTTMPEIVWGVIFSLLAAAEQQSREATGGDSSGAHLYAPG